MSFEKNWYTLAEAAEKFGLEQCKIQEWVEDGLVRSEEENKQIVRVHADDLELKLQELTGI
jgi:predicted site-specific integrase-resolvase